MKHHSWKNIEILDESWFHLATDYDSIRLPQAEDHHAREKKDFIPQINAPDCLEIIGFSILLIFSPKGKKD
jgi:hypothetical protein